MNEIDNAISSVCRGVHKKDIAQKKVKCRKCGYPVSAVANFRMCKRCGHAEVD